MFLVLALIVLSCSAQDPKICCFAPLQGGGHASTCTPGISQSLCERAGGLVEAQSTETCCCYGQNAAPSDKCLPNVLVSTCLGPSVLGRCEAVEVPRCCCVPAGAPGSDCVPRIPATLCEKAVGAQCFAPPVTTASPTVSGATTTSNTCTCVIPRTSGNIVLDLPRSVCTKYQGNCQTTAPTGAPTPKTDCCCIYAGATNADGSTTTATQIADPELMTPPRCIAQTPISVCEGRKRVGSCWTGPIPTPNPTPAPTTGAPTVAPRCYCVNPDSTTGAVLTDASGNPALILQHVCETKLGSTCVENTCCCKYPSAPLDPCIPGLTESLCFSVNGAECVNTYVFPSSVIGGTTDDSVFAWASPSGNTAPFTPGATPTSTINCGDAAGSTTNDPRVTVRVTQSGGLSTALVKDLTPAVPVNNVNVFKQQLSAEARVFVQQLSQSVTIDVAPSATGFLLYAINWRGDAATDGIYTIKVTPATSAPYQYEKVAGANPAPAATTTAGQFTLTVGTSGRWSGILAFTGPVDQVVVEFPAGGAESGSFGGVIPSLMSNGDALTLPPAATTSSLSGVTTGSTQAGATETAAVAESVVCASNQVAASTSPLGSFNFQFGCLTPPSVTDRVTVTLNFDTPPAADTLVLDAIQWAAGTYNFIQMNVGGAAAPPPTVEGGFAGAGATVTELNGVISFTISAKSSGSIRFYGQPQKIVIVVPSVDGCTGTPAKVSARELPLPAVPAPTSTPVVNVDPYAQTSA